MQEWPFRDSAPAGANHTTAAATTTTTPRPRLHLSRAHVTGVLVVLLVLGLWIYLTNSRHIRSAALTKERLRSRVRAPSALLRPRNTFQDVDRLTPSAHPALFAALQEIESMPAEDNEYFFVLDRQGRIWANGGQPAMALSEKGIRPGPSMINLEQEDAKDAKPVESIIQAAQQGGGFVVYNWNHPQSGEIKPKLSYAQEVEGTPLILGCGHYM